MKIQVNSSAYVAAHIWIAYHFGRPYSCEHCGDKSLRHRQYHWANISGEYKRIKSDWKRLCASCHKKMDVPTKLKCKRGHLYDDTNTYIYPNGRYHCRKCHTINQKEYLERKSYAHQA